MANPLPESIALPPDVVRTLAGMFANSDKVDRLGRHHALSKTSVSQSEAAELARLVALCQPERSLEIGFALGSSAIAIAVTRRAYGLVQRHIVLDPFQETVAHGVGLLEVERAGLSDAVEWRAEFSEAFLLHCREAGRQFDFIFIDGGHGVGQAVCDAFLAGAVLAPGGIIAIHDALLFSTMVSVRQLVYDAGAKFEVMALQPDGWVRPWVRLVKYAPRLGTWYATSVIPKIHRSLVALRRVK